MMRGFSKKAWPAYGCAIFYTLFLFSSIPFVRPFQKFVYNQYGKSYFGYFVLVAIVLCLIGCVFYLIKNADRGVSTKNYLWLAGVTGLYVYFTLKLWGCPEEAIHFLEYGLLSYLFYRALRHHVKDVTIYFTVAFIALFLGTIDEIIQWIVPVRYWDFRDVWLNFLSGGLLQLGLWKGIRPRIINKRVRPQSIWILSTIIGACIILLALCAPNTPSRMLMD